MTLLGSEGNWGRVRLPDGDEGWVLLKLVKPADERTVSDVSDAARMRRTDLELRLADAQAALAAAEAEAQIDRDALEVARSENAEFGRRLADSEAALTAAQAEAQADREALEAAQVMNADLERGRGNAEAAFASASATAQADSEALGAAQAANADLERRLGVADSALVSTSATAQTDREALEAADAENADFERRLSDAESALAAALAAAHSAAQTAAQADLEALNTARAKNTDLEHTVAVFETAADGDAERIADLTDRLRAAEIFFEESAKQRLETAEQLATLERENKELRKLARATNVRQTRPSVQPEPVAATPVRPPADQPQAEDLWAIVQDWAEAWSEQRVADYLAFYGSDFEPEDGSSRRQWESQRRARLSQPRIRVDVAFLDMRLETPDRPEIDFVQSYTSNSFEDVVVKTLALVREEGAWKIASERVK